MAETENDDKIFGTTSFTDEGFWYLKRMVSMFGSLPAVNWVVGEECDLDVDIAAQVLATVNTLDAYDHLIGLHTRKRNKPEPDGYNFEFWYDRLSGLTAPADTNVSYAPIHIQGAIDAPSVTYESMWDDVEPYFENTDWVFYVTESGTGGTGSVKPDDSPLTGNSAYKYRRQILCSALFRGFGGMNIYFGSI